MAREKKFCPHCGGELNNYRNPVPTVDIIIEIAGGGIVLIQRKNAPHGWALPGGFVDYGETVEQAAVREAYEETGLAVKDLTLFNVYSDPDRDPRLHTVSVVFTAAAAGQPAAGDDAADLGIFSKDRLPEPIAFDHERILHHFFRWRERRSGRNDTGLEEVSR